MSKSACSNQKSVLVAEANLPVEIRHSRGRFFYVDETGRTTPLTKQQAQEKFLYLMHHGMEMDNFDLELLAP